MGLRATKWSYNGAAEIARPDKTTPDQCLNATAKLDKANARVRPASLKLQIFGEDFTNLSLPRLLFFIEIERRACAQKSFGSLDNADT